MVGGWRWVQPVGGPGGCSPAAGLAHGCRDPRAERRAASAAVGGVPGQGRQGHRGHRGEGGREGGRPGLLRLTGSAWLVCACSCCGWCRRRWRSTATSAACSTPPKGEEARQAARWRMMTDHRQAPVSRWTDDPRAAAACMGVVGWEQRAQGGVHVRLHARAVAPLRLRPRGPGHAPAAREVPQAAQPR